MKAPGKTVMSVERENIFHYCEKFCTIVENIYTPPSLGSLSSRKKTLI